MYKIQCNSSSNRSPYRIQCNSSSNRSPYRIQCTSSSNRSPYRIQCNSSSNRSPYRIQYNSSSNWFQNLLFTKRTKSLGSKWTELQNTTHTVEHMMCVKNGLLTSSAAISGVILSMNSASVPTLAASLYDAISYSVVIM